MSSAASVKDRLKNYAKNSKRIFQDVLTVYILERVLFTDFKIRVCEQFYVERWYSSLWFIFG